MVSLFVLFVCLFSQSVGVFNKTIFPITFVGYEMSIYNL